MGAFWPWIAVAAILVGRGLAVRREQPSTTDAGCPAGVRVGITEQGNCATVDEGELLPKACCEAVSFTETSGLAAKAGALVTAKAHVNRVDGIEWNFMTNDFRYTGYETSFFGTIKGWFGSRERSDTIKEELVVGHFCQKRGTREQTYYASSFCYWLPEMTNSNFKGAGGAGVLWHGGKAPAGGKPLCASLAGQGQCLKCSACHNNARDKDSKADATSFAESLPLPSTCLKEREIERRCLGEYDSKAYPLKMEDQRCREVESRYTSALRAYEELESNLQRIPQQISGYPSRIDEAEREVVRSEERLRMVQQEEWSLRNRARLECDEYQREKGYSWWFNQLGGQTPTDQLLNSMGTTTCTSPWRPMDRNDGRYHHELRRYEEQVILYNQCERCRSAQDQLRSANSRYNSVNSDLAHARQRPPALRQELEQARRNLRSWQDREQGLRMTKGAMDAEWLPQKRKCESTYADYKNGKAYHMAACTPGFYGQSCEKACLDLQADREYGCGVMEGARPGDEMGLGGIEAVCAPPQPSWVMSPFTYTSLTEAPNVQCSRIMTNQQPRYAQMVLKAGWLWKKGRVGGWDKRYFVLESGDQVRSALLRYMDHDPTKEANAKESAHKSIIVWDAKSVTAKSGKDYSWKDGEECFLLTHFYREYKFCIPSDTADILGTRDAWMKHLQASITFPSK